MSGGISYRNPVIEIKDFQKLRRSAMIKERELWVAYLLWFFLGPVGVHKFFLGKTGMGILYLFTGGIFLIGWIIDLFTLPSQVRAYNDEVRSMRGEIPL
jgi:TM2 domain-containing membrane protein YozV